MGENETVKEEIVNNQKSNESKTESLNKKLETMNGVQSDSQIQKKAEIENETVDKKDVKNESEPENKSVPEKIDTFNNFISEKAKSPKISSSSPRGRGRGRKMSSSTGRRGSRSSRGRGHARSNKINSKSQPKKQQKPKKSSALSQMMNDMDNLKSNTSKSPSQSTESITKQPKKSIPKKPKTKKEKKPKVAQPQQSKSWFGRLFGSNTKKPEYKPSTAKTYIDPKTGEERTTYEVNTGQFEQVKQVWNDELQRYDFFDQNGNLLPQDDDDESDGDSLPARRTAIKSKSISSVSDEQPVKPSKLRPHIRPKQQREEKEDGNSDTQSNTESKEEKETNLSVQSLRKEILKLKKENHALKQQLSPNAANINYDSLDMDIMQKRVMDRLDQNHRILRYLHEWSDNMPLGVLRNLNNEWMQKNVVNDDDMSQNRSFFGISMFHILLVIMLTLCLVLWDSNNMNNVDMDIFNSTQQFLYELYFIIRQFVPQSLHVYEEFIFQIAQDTINQTTSLTQNIISAIKEDL